MWSIAASAIQVTNAILTTASVLGTFIDMGALGLVGRLCFAFLFLSSGAQKLASFQLPSGGPTMDIMAPKMDQFLDGVRSLTGADLPVPKELYVVALGIAIFLELAGGVLFLLGSPLGSCLLAIFLVAVTPVMHAFWNLKDGSHEHLVDMIMFFKNIALLGALFVILERPAKLKSKKE